ncbi:uncharacterized protein FTJAE_4256 [Fusarium tjaetaba]|uniref:Uncharacterized protein n=1 Tax=Fusarium tjaetaba TaxID=1567544 RepID=A0A8H5RXN3_9HYPO|nr:uncharacterized protein FTJAE_4256 [Fusarium tjaetaba]KAF5640958.1 hypothetical protein FTJAE_4256 [Fusarium tjaetaba]
METLEASQYSIDLEELVADDERDDLHSDIVGEFKRVLNTRDRTLDQAVDEAEDQKEPESSRSRSGAGSDQTPKEQQLYDKAQELANKLDELWFRTAVWKVFREAPRRIPVGDERIDLLVCTIDALGEMHKIPEATEGIYVCFPQRRSPASNA